METLGSYLKRERELRNISLKEVAKHTRVKEHLLKAIEEDQYVLLPTPTYVKGFLVSYARYLGLNPDDILHRYERDSKGENLIHPEAPPVNKTSWNVKYLWAIGGLAGGCLIASYFLFFRPSQTPNEPLPEKPVVRETFPPVPPAIPATTLVSKPEIKKEPISLQLKAAEETWVSVQVNDQPEKQITFKPGEGISYQASDRIRILIGNAGGLDLIYNGRPLERFGKTGEVVTVTFTSQGVETKHHEKSISPKDTE
jgi:transcriptional regulator with XRE-family HTH domain